MNAGPDVAEIVIRFNPVTKECAVSGPFHEKLICFGMLEIARDAISRHEEKKSPVLQIAGTLPTTSRG